jgi:hypothetical protein
MIHRLLLTAVSLSLGNTNAARADCRCPANDGSPVLITTGAPASPGFVVCGYQVERRAGKVRASEFDVVRCRDHTTVLEFGATRTADLEPQGDDLVVTEVSRWPVGPDGDWQYVPIARLVLRPDSTKAEPWKPLLEPPRMPALQVARFLSAYKRTRRGSGGRYEPGEKDIGRLFIAALSGNGEARDLFCQVARQAHVDGAAAEAYAIAVRDLLKGTGMPEAPQSEAATQCTHAFKKLRDSTARSRTAGQTHDLPPAIRAAVGRSGCEVPSSRFPYPTDTLAPIPHVAYFGPVLGADSSWVVVCQRGNSRVALVFPPGATASSHPVARLPLEWDPADPGCEGWISVTDSASVRAALARPRSPRLRRSEKSRSLHAGIIPDQCEGGTRQWYFTGERWLRIEAYWEESRGE